MCKFIYVCMCKCVYECMCERLTRVFGHSGPENPHVAYSVRRNKELDACTQTYKYNHSFRYPEYLFYPTMSSLEGVGYLTRNCRLNRLFIFCLSVPIYFCILLCVLIAACFIPMLLLLFRISFYTTIVSLLLPT